MLRKSETWAIEAIDSEQYLLSGTEMLFWTEMVFDPKELFQGTQCFLKKKKAITPSEIIAIHSNSRFSLKFIGIIPSPMMLLFLLFSWIMKLQFPYCIM